MAAEKLRDFSQPIDVPLLDATVAAFYGTGSKEQRSAADQILRELQNNPDMWLQVMHILQNTQNLNTKFLALQVLEGVIKYKWNALPTEQRDGMKNFISDVIVQLSSNEASFRTERLYVNKLNIILVQILKHEWPARWRSFIPDLDSAAKASESICENCMAILKLLSEEVFDFSRGEMTQQKIKELKQSLNSEFQLIHELCLYVLSASQRTELIRATLSTLHAFLTWIPLGYIFESPLLETLLKFFPLPVYRNLTLQCLTEVAALQQQPSLSPTRWVVAALQFGNFYDAQYIKMYNIFMVQLQSILPPTTNIPEAYVHGSNEEQAFVQNLALFFTSFYKVHIRILESTQENISALLLGLEYLINISYVDDTEVFKVCLDYWNVLVSELFDPQRSMESPAAAAGNMLGLQLLQRRQLYAGPMSKLRALMISRMAKPEEVLIVEDENGNIVCETMKDNDVLVQYKIMRETLIYLSHLDHDDTEKQMLRKLSKQLSGEDWTWNNLNTLCWAIGSISGSMMEEQENIFLVMVIRDLLNLCEITKGEDNKAVIASNIMYVVGQYPRFLRAHWKFLKTVVNKLFEFMHETHPGVQDMACDTFLKIVQKCRRKFVITQVGENEPFVSELLTGLPTTIVDLEPHQIHAFYESVGNMVQAESDAQKRDEYLQRLMELPNQKWLEIIGQARQNVDFLKEQDVIRIVLNILQTNTSVASSLGTYFLPQISLIFLDMLNVYRMYSELISKSIAEGGPFASRTSFVKLLRSVKRETLKLIETFLDKAEDQPQIGKQFVPPMFDPVLGDYARNVPDARESEVLSLFATIVNKYKATMVEDVPRIFEAVFQCTLEMITKNFEDYPEHWLKFFSLLRAIATHCFPALICLSSEQLKFVMDSIIWAFRHTERNIAETGLNLLLEMLKKFEVSEFCNQFYQSYFLTIEREIFAVLTDTFHKPGFKLHVLVLQHLFCLAETGAITQPLWDVATNPYPYPNNAAFVREFTIKLLSTSFPNMTAAEVTQFVNGLFQSTNDLSAFKTHIRDFLVQSKEFSAQELQRIKQELAMTCDAKNQALSHADDATKVAEIHTEKAEALSSEVTRLKALLDSKLETEASENKNVLELQKEIEALEQELEKAKGFEKKLTEKEAYIEQLNVELGAAKMAESYAHSVLEEWKKKVEELEVRVEEANKLERSASASLESVMKQLEGNNDLLHNAESEISSLKEKVALLEMTIGTQRGDFEDSVRRLLVAKEESLEMSKKVESIRSELETVKEEKAQALSNEKLAASSMQTLLEEKNKLIHELEVCRDEEEKSKKAMESLASALHEVSTEARDAKEKVLANHAEHESYEARIEDLKLVLKASNEKYESMLDEARHEIDLLTSGIENSKDVIENSKEEWEQRELNLVSCLKQTEEKNSSLGKEVNRLISLLKETEEEASAKREENLKEVEAEVLHLQEAVQEAKAESMKLKESLLDKENEFQNIFHENEELRSRELASIKKVEELSKLLEEATTRNQTKEQNGDLTDSEKDYDLLPKIVEFSEENGHGEEDISKAKLLVSTDEEGLKQSSQEESVVLNDDQSKKVESPKPENANGKLNEVDGSKQKDDKVGVEFKMWESCTIEKNESSPEREPKEEVESKNVDDGGEGVDKINGDGASVTEKENIDDGVLSSPSKQQEQQLKKKKKKPLLGKFGSLLKKKSSSSNHK